MQELENRRYKFFDETNMELKVGAGAENKLKNAKKYWLCREKFKLHGEVKVENQ